MKEWKTKLIALALILIICFAVDMKLKGFSSESKLEDGSKLITCIGKVVSIDAGKATGEAPEWTYSVDGQIVTLKILSGKYKGQEVFSANPFIGEYTDRVLRVGDTMYVIITLKGDTVSTGAVSLGEYVRTSFLLYTAGIFIALVILIGGLKGIKSIASLALSVVFIIAVLIPMCLQGYSPIWISILISALNTILTFLMIGGVSKKSVAGILGTIGGLIMTALLSFVSSKILHFTGQDVNFGFLELGKRLWMSPESTNWNFSGLLVAGMILGASGAIMDASMAVASAIEQVKKANPQTGIWACVRAGLNVGKDEMGTMANTLIFAYIGADLTLILMPMVEFGEMGRAMPMTRVINEEATSAEIVQAIAGTIGIILAIPITALIAGILMGRTSIDAQSEKEAPSVGLNPHYSPFAKGGKFSFLIPIALIIIMIGIHLVYTTSRHLSESQVEKDSQSVSEYVRARVVDKGKPIETPSFSPYSNETAKNEILKARLLGGSFKNESVLVQNIIDPGRMPLANIEIKPGDEIILKVDGTKAGIERILMNNYSRDGYLIYLTGLLVIVLAMVGRSQGIRTALALGISIALVIKVLVPLIAKGYNALLVVIVISGVIALLTLLIVTGFNRKTGSATIGILGGVIVASFVVLFADQKLHFTGISSSRTAVLAQFTVSEKLDFRNILMAGIIMGLLGTAMDAGIAIASAVREVKRANPKIHTSQLISAGMSVGTDLLGTITNTLIFAYLGLRLILLMTFAGTTIFTGSKIEILSTETISAELLRVLAGSIGLVLTIPITATVSALWDKIVGFLGIGKTVIH
jgi:uncharacterized membrane protein